MCTYPVLFASYSAQAVALNVALVANELEVGKEVVDVLKMP